MFSDKRNFFLKSIRHWGGPVFEVRWEACTTELARSDPRQALLFRGLRKWRRATEERCTPKPSAFCFFFGRCKKERRLIWKVQINFQLAICSCFLLDQKKEPKKNQGFAIKLKRKSSSLSISIFKRFILKAPENVIFSVIYFTSVPQLPQKCYIFSSPLKTFLARPFLINLNCFSKSLNEIIFGIGVDRFLKCVEKHVRPS